MKGRQVLPLAIVAVLILSTSGLSGFTLQALEDTVGSQWTKEQYQDWLNTARYPDWKVYENPAEFRQAINDYFWSIEQAYPGENICCAAEWAKLRLGEDISKATAEEILREFSTEEISWLILQGVLEPS